MSSTKQSLAGIEDLLFAVKDYVPTGLFELKDTPTGYQGHSGDYLIVNDNESGIHFTGIEKIASDLTDYGFGGNDSESITDFTGLHDTPINYQSGYYLRSTETGLEYIDSTGIAKDIPVIPKEYNSSNDLPVPAIDYDGEIVQVGCELYISCDGEWKPLVSIDRLPLSEAEQTLYPACVTTAGESLQYIDYTDTVLNENSSLILQASLNGQTTDDVLHEVCTFQNIDGQSNDTSSEGTWQNITNSYNFLSCAVQQETNQIRGSNTTWGNRRGNLYKLRGPGVSCEFNRSGTVIAFGWGDDEGISTPFVDVLKINASNGSLQLANHIAELKPSIATDLWGRSISMNDDGTIVAAVEPRFSNTNGGHGAIVIFELNLDTNSTTEKHVIELPLTNSDYFSNNEGYNDIEERLINVQLSGDGKTLAVSFLHNYFDTNPKALFIYNYNESTQVWNLIQTFNGIGFQDLKLSKDGSTIAVKCGYSIGGNLSYDVGGVSNSNPTGQPDSNTRTAYFHGIKVFRRDSQNIWSEKENVSSFDLGIQEAVITGGIDWSLPISIHLGMTFDLSRDGNAILYQLPDSLSFNSNHNYYTPAQRTISFVDRITGPVGVITWNGESWNRLGDLLFDEGTFGFNFSKPIDGSLNNNTQQGGISEDGTLLMLASRPMRPESSYTTNMNFAKWTGSGWTKISKQFHSSSSSPAALHGGYTMSKQPNPELNSIIGYVGYNESSDDEFYFTEECSTNLVSGGTISDNSNISSCGVVRIKDTGYKWGLFPTDTQITVQAFPSTNCTFDGWTGGNFADPNSLETTLIITDSTSITGNFSVI